MNHEMRWGGGEKEKTYRPPALVLFLLLISELDLFSCHYNMDPQSAGTIRRLEEEKNRYSYRGVILRGY